MSIHERGFTLVEIIVVIVTIAILAAFSVVTYGAWRLNTAKTEVSNGVSQFKAQLEDARNFNDVYPSTIPSSFRAVPTDTTITNHGTVRFKYHALNADGSSYCAHILTLTGLTGTGTSVYISPPSITTAQDTKPSTPSCDETVPTF